MATKQGKKKTVKPAATATRKPKAPAPKSCAAKRSSGVQTARKGGKTPEKKESTPKKNIFAGASEVSVTDNKFIVTRIKTEQKDGRYEKREVREYHDKTPENVRAFNDRVTNSPVKKVSVKLN